MKKPRKPACLAKSMRNPSMSSPPPPPPPSQILLLKTQFSALQFIQSPIPKSQSPAMRLLECSLALVVLVCAFTSSSAAPKVPRSSKLSKTSPEPSESLPAVEADTTDLKDASRAKKQTTTFCVEIKAGAGQPVQQVCEPQLPQQPQQVIPPPPPPPQEPESETYLVWPPAETQETISYVQVPVVHHHTPSLPQIVVKPGHHHHHHDQAPAPPPPPPPAPPAHHHVPSSPCVDGSSSGSGSSAVVIPGSSGYTDFPGAVVLPSGGGSSGSPCPPCPCGPTPHALISLFRNGMGEQGMMMPQGMEGMDARMMMPGMEQWNSGMMPMDPMAKMSMGGMGPMGPMGMDMRAAQMMEPMVDSMGMARHHHHLHKHYPSNQPYVIKCGAGGITTSSLPYGYRAMGMGGNAAEMQMNPSMEMQRTHSHPNIPQIVVAPPQGQSSSLSPNSQSSPCHEPQFKHWNTRSADQPRDSSDMNAEASGPSAQEVAAPVPSEANLSPSQMLNQMRGASPGQRVTREENTDANVQMSIIGPGGQSYILGEPKGALVGETSDDRREELSKREVEASADDSQ